MMLAATLAPGHTPGQQASLALSECVMNTSTRTTNHNPETRGHGDAQGTHTMPDGTVMAGAHHAPTAALRPTLKRKNPRLLRPSAMLACGLLSPFSKR